MDYQGNAKKQKRSPGPSTTGNTSSSSASGGEFEVFLSFCGKDTRKTFTDFLYNDLIDAGIRTFRDNEELHVGEEIGLELLKAIKVSKISIPVFSKNYASSKWCLRELAQMVECRTTLGQKILPIFYDVEPSDVRHQTGSFEQAFLNHQERFDGTIVQGWKEALTKVGELKGWELKNETDGHEGELAKKVTIEVLIELKKNYMDVTEDLVGIEDQVKEMEELLNAYSDAVQIVGILGMGGIGKTTLAKVIYNKISEHFESFSFLENVRERIQQHEGLVGLQNELCLNRKALDNIANVDERRNMIKDTVCRKKVFIVLDDVDEKSQFDKLVGKREWFAPGSKIIVTTRNKQVLNLIAVDSTFEPPPMEFNHSLQLFSKHAFGKDFPPEGYDTLSRKFVDTAAGLPLALEIIGSYLYGREKSSWQGILKKLEKIPPENVQKKLKISYEALDYQQKQIFLDIACFLIGEEKHVAFYMWEDCEFYPEDGIGVLVLRSLIKIRDDKLWMHDQLRDLGRDIVRCEHSNEPWKRSRVWSHADALKTMKRCNETQKDEAFKFDALHIEHDLFMESYFSSPKREFGLLKNLRYLRVDNEWVFLFDDDDERFHGIQKNIGDLEHDFPNLRWIKWDRFQWWLYKENIFDLENLVILDLPYSSLRLREAHESDKSGEADKSGERCETDFEHPQRAPISKIKLQMAKNLKVLNLTGCVGLIETPDFSTFAALEILILRWCGQLVKIDQSIENLTSLRVLDISECFRIKELPDAIGNLEKLEEINASNCEELKGEFPDIRRLSYLRILNLDSTQICSLKGSIFELIRLETLDLCDGVLECLPEGELPSSLTSLRVTCDSMKTFPCLSELTNLRELCLRRSFDLMEIPNLSNLAMLKNLNLAHCGKLADVGGLSFLKSLEVLNLSYCTSLKGILDLSNLRKLKQLDIGGWENLNAIRGFEKLESLVMLDIACCEMEKSPDFSNLKKLEKLVASGCKKLSKIVGLEELKSLMMLNICGTTLTENSLNLPNTTILTDSSDDYDVIRWGRNILSGL